MLKRFLRNIAIVSLLFFITTPHAAQAQSYKSTVNYYSMVRTMVLHTATNQNSQILGVSASSSPTPTNTPTPSLTLKEIFLRRRLTPTPTPLVTIVPTQAVTVSNDPMTFVMNQINDYRKSLGLSPVTTSTQTCNFAQIRANEIVTDFSHNGFQQRINNKTIPYTSWTKITENLAMTSSYKQVVTLWKNSPGHAANMRENTPYVCVRQNGNYFAYEGMKP